MFFVIVTVLIKKGFNINIEESVGLEVKFKNDEYVKVGVKIIFKKEVFEFDIVFKVRVFLTEEIVNFRSGIILISFLYFKQNFEFVKQLVEKNFNVFVMDMILRISRVQVFDVLSFMVNIFGYKVVVEVVNNFGRFFIGKEKRGNNINVYINYEGYLEEVD